MSKSTHILALDTQPYKVLLGNREFLLFFVAGTSSCLGTTVMQIALAFALLRGGYSPGALGFVYAAEAVPMLLLIVLGGIAGDRWQARIIMALSDGLRCSTQIALAFCLYFSHPPVYLLMLLASLIGAGNAFFGPASAAAVPQLVEEGDLTAANNLFNMATASLAVAGPLVAGIIIVHIGAYSAVVLDAVSYGLSGMLLIMMRPMLAATEPAGSFFRDVRVGISEFDRHPWLKLITIQLGLLSLLVFAPFAVIGPMIFFKGPEGPALWGLVTGAGGIGAIAAGLCIVGRRFERPLVVFELGIALLGLPLLLLFFRVSYVPLAIGCAICGAASAILNVVFTSAVQTRVPQARLARVSALISFVLLLFAPVGFVLAGLISSYIGLSGELLLGPAVLLSSVALSLISKDIRQFKWSVPAGGLDCETPS